MLLASAAANRLGAAPPPAPRTTAPPTGVVKFQASTQLVIETVTVKDKNGKPVEGLTAKDFTITEDGVAQTISFCEFQKLDEIGPAELDAGPRTRRAVTAPRPRAARGRRRHGAPDHARKARRHPVSRPAADGDVLRHERHAGARPDPRAKPRRMKFIKTQMQPADLMAIMAFNGAAVQVLQDFTDKNATTCETRHQQALHRR